MQLVQKHLKQMEENTLSSLGLSSLAAYCVQN